MSPPAPILPCLWLFTDERVPDNDLIAIITHLPKGSGSFFAIMGWLRLNGAH